MKKLFTAPLSDRRNIMELLSEIKQVSNQNLHLTSILEERSRTIEHLANQNLNLASILEETSRTMEHLANQNLNLASITEVRSRTIEHVANQNLNLASITEERSRTIEHVANQNLFAAQYQIDLSQKIYIESMLGAMTFKNSPLFNARQIIFLKTDYALANASNDYINPESTVEGIVRPTFFARNCIELLGQEIKCLDLGTGSAGLVFEYAMNGVFAVGVDGSDFCNRYKIGYWPLLINNLFNCDITKPFSFISIQNNINFYFNIITMWEVLEHIEEDDLNGLFKNINEHLRSPNGYFIGSISLLEYVDKNGRPYHVTLKSKKWWADKFQENALIMIESHPFNEKFFCRGVGSRFQDAHNYLLYPEEGFHFVAIKSNGYFDSLALKDKEICPLIQGGS